MALSDEQISLMAFNDDPGDWNNLAFRDCWVNGYKTGARAIETEVHKQDDALIRQMQEALEDGHDFAIECIHRFAEAMNGYHKDQLTKLEQEAQPNYVVSLVVLKGIPTGFNTQNKLYAVNAASSNEAVSKAVLQMPNDFPEHRLHTACFVAIPAQPAPQPAPAPLSEDVVQDAAFEAVRKQGANHD